MIKVKVVVTCLCNHINDYMFITACKIFQTKSMYAIMMMIKVVVVVTGIFHDNMIITAHEIG